jgi:hypothetical protein
MSYAATLTPDFSSMAQELGAKRGKAVAKTVSTGEELVPAEAFSRMQREGKSFLRRPALNGATVDAEGLTNNYGVEPIMYFATFPDAEQARQYVYQGIAAVGLVMGLILTSVAVS